ncbi:L,D-transpeptidase family protein [Lichenifustis flavocetrariae]|uniref:L,D-transpeptidase family protein n=1 Tax=Lichenifustis flavocetrariae TaxID=2949735 RepID=A0AA41YRV0_9HYPH|nr:L,D-transpeptidase family protein [Lichenifustis flavocetrariae]MCW6507029.1 L,D-transpeptidase family protein [Lichenifustis flavocetrariae]
MSKKAVHIMRRHRAAAVSLGLSAVLLGGGGLGSAAAQAVLASRSAHSEADVLVARPFALPAAFRFEETAPTPFVDVTGSIKPTDAVFRAPTDPVLQPVVVAPDLGIAPPDLPAAPTLDARSTAGLSPQDLEQALPSFKAPSEVQKAGLTADQVRERQSDRDAIAAFYESRNHAPLWIEGTHFSLSARAALSRIERAGEDGLNLHGFSVPVLHDPTAVELAQAELALSEAVVAYARQAGGARVDPLQINRLITAKRTLVDVPQILSSVIGAPDAGAALRAFNPPQPGYAALRAKLAELRQAAPVARAGIPLGPTLRLGMRDARVPLIRSRFGLDAAAADPSPDDLVYDTKVVAAVAEFQRLNGLPASGMLTPRTIAALSGGNPARLENELVANMERWRWVPRDLGTDHLTVNVPDFSLDVVQGGAVTHHARVVVGKPDHQTPIFSDAMRFIIVNPYWNVPLSIIKKEMLPKLAQDPNYFANHGYEVIERNGVTFVRQPPGDDNALGRIKFMFPNQHAVYLHDTNARALFGKEKRAFSHGCVRVDQPFKLAEVLLGPDRGWTEKRVKKMIGGEERTINLPSPLPIHIVYFTAFVDERGGLQLRDDVYGYSEKVKLALGLRD